MQIESPKADSPKRKRRWFQFSLRTLLVLASILCLVGGWFAIQIRVVQQRRAMRQWVEKLGGACTEEELFLPERGTFAAEAPSLMRRWLGDEIVRFVFIPGKINEDDEKRIAVCFPGAVRLPSDRALRLGPAGIRVRDELSEEQQAVASLRKLGGEVIRSNVKPTWQESLVFGDDPPISHRVTWACLSNYRPGDNDYSTEVPQLLEAFPHLQFVNVDYGNCKIPDDQSMANSLDISAIKAKFPRVSIGGTID